MDLRYLSLHNFRNFAHVEEIYFPPGALLVAAAPNATGKTNFLEAVVMLLRARSFRVATEECVRWGEDGFTVRGAVQLKEAEATIGVQYHKPTKKIRVEENGVPASTVTFFNHYPFVLFLPEDTFMFSRGPAQRRNFMNRVLISAPAYVSALVQYQRVLRQRNVALKSAEAMEDMAAWTDLLVEHGLVLWQHRRSLSEFLDSHLGDLYKSISGEERNFSVALSAQARSEEEFRAALEKSFAYERRFGFTMQGPHRDDLEVRTEGRVLPSALSQGQTRSVIIALKLGAYRYLEQVTGERPLLLLDEVLSELDNARQDELLKNLPQAQALLTCTAVPAVLRQRSNVHLLDLRAIIDESAPAAPQAAKLVAEPAVEVSGV